MGDRQEFEVWMNANMPLCHFLKNPNGVYTDPRTDAFWFVWQASRNQALEDAAKIAENMGPACEEVYGFGAECISTADDIALAIRAKKQ